MEVGRESPGTLSRYPSRKRRNSVCGHPTVSSQFGYSGEERVIATSDFSATPREKWHPPPPCLVEVCASSATCVGYFGSSGGEIADGKQSFPTTTRPLNGGGTTGGLATGEKVSQPLAHTHQEEQDGGTEHTPMDYRANPTGGVGCCEVQQKLSMGVPHPLRGTGQSCSADRGEETGAEAVVAREGTEAKVGTKRRTNGRNQSKNAGKGTLAGDIDRVQRKSIVNNRYTERRPDTDTISGSMPPARTEGGKSYNKDRNRDEVPADPVVGDPHDEPGPTFRHYSGHNDDDVDRNTEGQAYGDAGVGTALVSPAATAGAEVAAAPSSKAPITFQFSTPELAATFLPVREKRSVRRQQQQQSQLLAESLAHHQHQTEPLNRQQPSCQHRHNASEDQDDRSECTIS